MHPLRVLLSLLVVVAWASVGALTPAVADPVELDGEPVPALSTDPEAPTFLTVGRWRTTLEPSGSDLQFAYRRTSRDSTVFLAVNGSATVAQQGFELRAYATNAERTSCGDARASASMSWPRVVLGANLVVGPKDHGIRDSQCLTTEVVRFTIGRGNQSFDDPLPLSITVVEESALQDPYEELPGAPDPEPAFVAPTPSTPTDVPGGTTLADAPLLEDGSFTGRLREGEQVFYRVHLDWGQALAAQVDLAPLTGADLEAVGAFGVDVAMDGYNPVRRMTDSLPDDTDSTATVGEEPVELTYGYGPVRYLNRYGVNSAYAPGDYYLVLSVEAPGDRDPVVLDYTLSVEVQGEAEPGPGYVAEEPFLIAPDQRSQVVSGTPRMGGGDSEHGWLTPRRTGGLALGLVGLVCLGLGAVRLRR